MPGARVGCLSKPVSGIGNAVLYNTVKLSFGDVIARLRDACKRCVRDHDTMRNEVELDRNSVD
jgi:hypothetical protein